MHRLRRLWQLLPRLALGVALALVLLTVLQVAVLRFVDPPLTLTMVGAAYDYHRVEGHWRLPKRQ